MMKIREGLLFLLCYTGLEEVSVIHKFGALQN
jgi:hypothetical protein